MVAALLALAGCVETPVCDAGGAVCGTESVRTYGSEQDRAAAFATCGSWAIRCAPDGFFGGETDAPVCVGGEPVCPSGGAPQCAHVVCDGLASFGPGYVAP